MTQFVFNEILQEWHCLRRVRVDSCILKCLSYTVYCYNSCVSPILSHCVSSFIVSQVS